MRTAGEAKAAAALFTTEIIALDLGWAAGIGATTYALICPQTLPTPLVEEAVEIASEYGVELLQLTGPALTSGTPPQHVFFQVAAAEAASRQPPANPATETPSRKDDDPPE